MFRKGYKKRANGPWQQAMHAKNPKPPRPGQDECVICGQGVNRPAQTIATDVGQGEFLTPVEAAKLRGASGVVSDFPIGPECAKDRRLRGYVRPAEAQKAVE